MRSDLFMQVKHPIPGLILKYIIRIILASAIAAAFGCGSEYEILLEDSPGYPTKNPVIYWSESNGTINRIYTDGTGNTAVITSSYSPLDICIYTSGRRIFWTEYTGSSCRIMRAELDGSNNTSVYSVSTTLPSFGPSAITIDNTNGNIYWNEFSNASVHNNIWKAGISSDLLTGTKWSNDLARYYVYSICVDEINNKLFFSSNNYYDVSITIASGNGGDLYMGSSVTSKTESSPLSLTGPSANSVPINGIAVDGAGGHVFFVTNTAHGVYPKAIMRRDLSLGNEDVWLYLGPGDTRDIQKIALDLTNRKIYWTSQTDNRIYRADMDTQYPTVETFLQLDTTPTGICITQ